MGKNIDQLSRDGCIELFERSFSRSERSGLAHVTILFILFSTNEVLPKFIALLIFFLCEINPVFKINMKDVESLYKSFKSERSNMDLLHSGTVLIEEWLL